jgi:hypothetical protein
MPSAVAALNVGVTHDVVKRGRLIGELLSSCYSLWTAIARVGTDRVVGFWKIPPKHVLALYTYRILRFWVLRRNAAGLASFWAG